MTAGELWIQWGDGGNLLYRDASDTLRFVSRTLTILAPSGLMTVHVPGEIAIDYASKSLYWITSRIDGGQRVYGRAQLTLTGNPAWRPGLYISGEQLCVGIDDLEYGATY